MCYGRAYLDDCGVCSGGITGHDKNTDQDCDGVCFGSHTVGCPATLHLNETDIPFRFSLAGGFIQSHRVQFTNVGDYAFIFQKQLPLVLNDDREPYLTLRWYIRGKEVKLKDEVIQPGESFVLDIEANMERLHPGSSSLIGYRQSQEMQVLLCFPFHCSSYSLR